MDHVVGVLGNGMTVKVELATGNLFLRYPVVSVGTPSGPVDVALAYNYL